MSSSTKTTQVKTNRKIPINNFLKRKPTKKKISKQEKGKIGLKELKSFKKNLRIP